MTSNDKLEDLLKQMYAQEEETIDTSDIIDEEWQKFESEHFAPKHHSWGWMQIYRLRYYTHCQQQPLAAD